MVVFLGLLTLLPVLHYCKTVYDGKERRTRWHSRRLTLKARELPAHPCCTCPTLQALSTAVVLRSLLLAESVAVLLRAIRGLWCWACSRT